MFIGEIVDVKADSHVLNEKNLPDIEKVKPIIWNPAARAKRIGQAFSIGARAKICARAPFLILSNYLQFIKLKGTPPNYSCAHIDKR